MKFFRIAVLCVFTVVLIAFGAFFVKDEFMTDKTYPVIEFGEKELRVLSSADEKDFLKDVRAYDKKDGDLTDGIIIESISKFNNCHVFSMLLSFVKKLYTQLYMG